MVRYTCRHKGGEPYECHTAFQPWSAASCSRDTAPWMSAGSCSRDTAPWMSAASCSRDTALWMSVGSSLPCMPVRSAAPWTCATPCNTHSSSAVLHRGHAPHPATHTQAVQCCTVDMRHTLQHTHSSSAVLHRGHAPHPATHYQAVQCCTVDMRHTLQHTIKQCSAAPWTCATPCNTLSSSAVLHRGHAPHPATHYQAVHACMHACMHVVVCCCGGP